jgi:hypothetical protein
VEIVLFRIQTDQPDLAKSPDLKGAYKSVLRELGLYIPFAPVEEKGYKSMINLPDWSNIHSIIIKFENHVKTEGFFSSNGMFFLKRDQGRCT